MERARGNRIPDAEVTDPRTWEMPLVVQAVSAFRSRRQADQFFGVDDRQQWFPRHGRRVVGFVDHDMIERRRIDRRTRSERVDGRKDMTADRRPLAVVQQFTKPGLLQRVAKHAAGLIEDLAAMRDVQQRIDTPCLA